MAKIKERIVSMKFGNSQYGHGTRNGGYVPPRDYINPAMAPVFNRIAADVTKAVKNG